MDLPNTFNSVLFATRQPSTDAGLSANLALLLQDPHSPPLLVRAAQVAYTSLQPDPSGGMVYTDDLAPVEWVTNSLIINFIVSGGVDDLH
jgi:hypothetical protein